MKRAPAVFLTALLLAGCGGGGGTNSGLPAPSKAATQSVKGSVNLVIPGASTQSSARARYPQFVSPNANSVALSVNGGADQLFDVSSSSSLCTSTAAGGRTCTLTFGAPAGSDTFAFEIFQGTGGTGTLLATATTTQAIAAGAAFDFAVALNAAVGTVVANLVTNSNNHQCPFSPGSFNGINEGCPGSAPITITVYDPSGAQVTGTVPYASPIALSVNDPSVSFSPTQITAPGQTETISYSGAAFGTGITNTIGVSLTVAGVVIPLTVPVEHAYLYVAHSNAPVGTPPTGNGSITVYQYGSSGATGPVRTLSGAATNITTPIKPLVDSSGNLYVLDNNIPAGPSFNPSILVFAPGVAGNVPPARQITNLGLVNGHNACSDMVFDPTGNYLFVSCGLDVWTFVAASSGPAVVSADYENDSQSISNGLAFDQTGNLYVADQDANAIFMIPGPVSPTAGGLYGGPALTTPNGWPATVAPFFIAVDNNQTLYAPVWYQNATAGAPDAQAELPIWKASNLTANSPPSAFLTGAPFTTQHAQAGIALDWDGNVYVDDPFTNVVTEFSQATIAAASLGTTATVLRTLNNSGVAGSLGMTIGP